MSQHQSRSQRNASRVRHMAHTHAPDALAALGGAWRDNSGNVVRVYRRDGWLVAVDVIGTGRGYIVDTQGQAGGCPVDAPVETWYGAGERYEDAAEAMHEVAVAKFAE